MCDPTRRSVGSVQFRQLSHPLKVLKVFCKKAKISIAFSEKMCYFIKAVVNSMFPGVAQLVARLTGGQEAVSSSLATRTTKEPEIARFQALFLTF